MEETKTLDELIKEESVDQESALEDEEPETFVYTILW